MYEVADDTYCYPGTTVLKNKLEIRRQDVLDEFETEMTDLRAAEPLPPGNLDYQHYRSIHRHLFQDVYDWAGQPRSVRISKGGNPFCYPEYIEAQANKLFDELASAHFLAELNAIHPFREGNGRVQLTFLTLLAEHAGHPLNHERLEPKCVMDAMIASFGGDEEPLANVLADLIEE